VDGPALKPKWRKRKRFFLKMLDISKVKSAKVVYSLRNKSILKKKFFKKKGISIIKRTQTDSTDVILTIFDSKVKVVFSRLKRNTITSV